MMFVKGTESALFVERVWNTVVFLDGCLLRNVSGYRVTEWSQHRVACREQLYVRPTG
jgi:hypothetical protein